MLQPFAPRAAAPKGELRKSGDVTEVWAAKKEGAGFERCLLKYSLVQLEWVGENKTSKGLLKNESFMNVDLNDLDLTLQTATKSHVFRFSSKEDAAKWKELLTKHV